jgi:hypothetical protein
MRDVGDQIEGVNEKVHELEQHVQKVSLLIADVESTLVPMLIVECVFFRMVQCAEMLSSSLGTSGSLCSTLSWLTQVLWFLGKRKRIEDETIAEEPVIASASTQTLAAPAQAQSSVQTSSPIVDSQASPVAEPPKKKARSGLGTFLLGALAGSVATVGALAAYGWNEEMAIETGAGW